MRHMPAEPSPSTAQPATPGPDSIGTKELSDDKMFHLLQNERRRQVIRYLSDVEGTVSMRDIAEQVAAWEHDTSVQALKSDERQRVYIPLYQNHLPKLDEEGVIEYNQSRGTVKRTELADQLEQYLDTQSEEVDAPAALPPDDAETAEGTVQWTDLYLGATGAGGVLFMLAVTGVPGVSIFSDLLLAALMLVTFATVTCIHTVYDQGHSF